jgi:hypothetical protein
MAHGRTKAICTPTGFMKAEGVGGRRWHARSEVASTGGDLISTIWLHRIMPKQIRLALDVSWTQVETAWRMRASWVAGQYPDIDRSEAGRPARRVCHWADLLAPVYSFVRPPFSEPQPGLALRQRRQPVSAGVGKPSCFAAHVGFQAWCPVRESNPRRLLTKQERCHCA